MSSRRGRVYIWSIEDRGLTSFEADTNLEGVCGFWGQEGELGGDPRWAGRTTEQAANLTETQTHPVHNVVTAGRRIQVIWLSGPNTLQWTLVLCLRSGRLLMFSTPVRCLTTAIPPWHSLSSAFSSDVTGSRIYTNHTPATALSQSETESCPVYLSCKKAERSYQLFISGEESQLLSLSLSRLKLTWLTVFQLSVMTSQTKNFKRSLESFFVFI